MQLTDASAWYDYLCLPAVWQHTSWNVQQPDDLLPSLQAFASNLPDAPRRFAVIDNSSGRLAGTVGFHTVSALNRTAELAYDFHPDYWGRGLATAVAQAALQWALQEGHLHRVQATVLPSNLRSIRVIEKPACSSKAYSEISVWYAAFLKIFVYMPACTTLMQSNHDQYEKTNGSHDAGAAYDGSCNRTEHTANHGKNQHRHSGIYDGRLQSVSGPRTRRHAGLVRLLCAARCDLLARRY
jgi:RimJ/RimL family protein N-acetyltransferase